MPPFSFAATRPDYGESSAASSAAAAISAEIEYEPNLRSLPILSSATTPAEVRVVREDEVRVFVRGTEHDSADSGDDFELL
jgi:hypothetical protein